MRASALVGALLIVTACSSSTGDVDATFIPPAKYQHLDCDGLAAEAVQMRERLMDLHHYIEESANLGVEGRALSWVVAGPPWILIDLLLLSPKIGAAERQALSDLKGEIESLRQNILRKGCNFEPPAAEEVTQVLKLAG